MKIILLIVCFAIGGTTSTRLERSSGGTPIRIHDASFFVSIKKNDVHKCGGAMITKRHVLTAAICVVDFWNKLDYENEVVAGTVKKYEGGTKYRIELIMLVEENTNRRFDLAVLVLPSNFTGNYKRHPLPIDRPSFNVTAYLFAFESAFNPKKNTRLQELSVLPYPAYQYGENDDVDEQTQFRIFLGLGARDYVWQEDTGGPIVQNGRLVGIVSEWKLGAEAHPIFIWVHKFGSRLKQLVPDANISRATRNS